MNLYIQLTLLHKSLWQERESCSGVGWVYLLVEAGAGDGSFFDDVGLPPTRQRVTGRCNYDIYLIVR